MSDKLKSIEVEIDCPDCDNKITTSIVDVAQEKTIKCHSCGSDIKLIDEGNGAKKAAKDLDEIDDLLDNLGS